MRSQYSHARLVVDIVSMRLFVSILATFFPVAADDGGGILDSHLFFYHRYTALADWHHARGRTVKAEKLEAIAEAYYQAAPGDDDDPPEAATMALPVPRPPLKTNAVSTTRVTHPRPEPPGDMVPSHAR
jgi:hypothetical protein